MVRCVAMRGGDSFARCAFVNIEFSPKQRRLTGNGPAASYLRLLHGLDLSSISSPASLALKRAWP